MLNMNDNIRSWLATFSEPANRLKLYYTPEAYAKTTLLVHEYPEEIGWNMVVKPYKDGYQVSDIVVYPQETSPAFIHADESKYGLWKADLPDEIEANLFGHGHSHVNMGVFASSVDAQQQFEETKLKGKGFYLFQIWNKSNHVSSFFYDLDNKILYETPDIDMIVDDTFLIESYKNVSKLTGVNFCEFE